MPLIMPIKDLRNTTEISPILHTRNRSLFLSQKMDIVTWLL